LQPIKMTQPRGRTRMSLIVALINGLLGVICGVRFRIQIFIPLIAIVLVEVSLLRLSGVGSVFWSAVVLICSLEMGYLVGSAFSTFSTLFVGFRPHTPFQGREHSRLSHN
jgi:hypothetical protein